jgi:hypothetical protein
MTENQVVGKTENNIHLDESGLEERAELGIDGNAGYALFGANLQEGEAVFVEVADPPGLENQLVACKVALLRLKDKLNKPNLSYYFGPNHPYGKN